MSSGDRAGEVARLSPPPRQLSRRLEMIPASDRNVCRPPSGPVRRAERLCHQPRNRSVRGRWASRSCSGGSACRPTCLDGWQTVSVEAGAGACTRERDGDTHTVQSLGSLTASRAEGPRPRPRCSPIGQGRGSRFSCRAGPDTSASLIAVQAGVGAKDRGSRIERETGPIAERASSSRPSCERTRSS
jgi:hypothetical protein